MDKEQRAEYMREYAKKNAGYFSEKQKLWAERHKEKVLAYRLEYYRKNLESERQKARNRYYAMTDEQRAQRRAYQREYYKRQKLKIIRGEG